ncbi:drug:proton antiporter [Undibacterium sp. Ren11W]|uniref:drug:proton antiporter n=1 Tax=Undibacterium sp. Ren11W TaxID=3413045 RepID=UPI003BF3B6DD
MRDPNYILWYVNSPEVSAAFYAGLLEHDPVEASPGFALFVLQSGVKLGLWARDDVAPAVSAQPGCGELAFAVADHAAVEHMHTDWQSRGLRIAQAPCALNFGYTFVALDPDGHRLRVFAPTPA